MDVLLAGKMVFVVVGAIPLLIFGIFYGAPSHPLGSVSGTALPVTALPVKQTSGQNQIQDAIEGSGDNPEQVLAKTYNESAASEIDRCTSNSIDHILCDTTMSMLIKSCKDSATWVSACDDPRLAQYKSTA